MNGDQSTNEILRVVGSLESSVIRLEKVVDKFDEKFDEKFAPVVRTCQTFEEYAKARSDIPIRLAAVEKIADDFMKTKPVLEEQSEYIDKLRTTIKACIIAAGTINAVVLFLIAVLTWMFNTGHLRLIP